MKYAIYDFSQAEIVKYNDEHPQDKLTIEDLMIFRWFTHFAAIPKTQDGRTAMWRKIFDGEVYYWINYQALIEEFPLFDIQTKKTIARRFDKYVSGGLMKKKVYKARNKGSLTFFTFTSEFSRFEYDENNQNQKINPHSAEKNKIQEENEELMEEFTEVREDRSVFSKTDDNLEETEMSSLKSDEEVREDRSVFSKELERTEMSSPLNNTLTKINTLTTAADNNSNSNPNDKAAAVLYLRQIINKILGENSDTLFSDDFFTDIVEKSGLTTNEYEDYIKYAYKKTLDTQDVHDFSKYFYKTVTKKYFVMNYFAFKKQEALSSNKNTPGGPSAAKDSAPRPDFKCPVCGVVHGYSKSCPNCNLPPDSDRTTIEMHKIRFHRGENVYKKLTAELASRKKAIMPVFELSKAAKWNNEQEKIIEKYKKEE